MENPARKAGNGRASNASQSPVQPRADGNCWQPALIPVGLWRGLQEVRGLTSRDTSRYMRLSGEVYGAKCTRYGEASDAPGLTRSSIVNSGSEWRCHNKVGSFIDQSDDSVNFLCLSLTPSHWITNIYGLTGLLLVGLNTAEAIWA
ncbi:hypothetical protein FOC1_g10005805 [Fusarium oxysporum f. sp. cubense race 1]|uniref:Uncharacterized protein n=1 Tax=Fusarium oxysporum f. sp. cubense (strain race 1) TaxID=1229664 RepID=N4U5M9_FUSC1|nr:hypothetical protein FOC1_g10005805 [Fusarium oxysporum f. sp. cubense race 1]